MRLLLLTLIALALAGCSLASDDDGEVPQRNASDLATVRARAGIAESTPTVRAATMTPSPTQATGTETPDPQRGSATDEAMRATLMKPSDISSMWTVGGSYSLATASLCGNPGIEEHFQATGVAHASFSASSGERAEQWVVRMTGADAEAAMEYARTSLTCEEHTQPLQGGSNAYWKFTPIESPLDADDVHTLSVKITYQNPAFTPRMGNVLFARHGEYVVILMHDGFTIQPDLIVRMAQAAMERIEAIADSSA